MTRRTFGTIEALLAAVERGELPGAIHVVRLHADRCPAPGSECKCKPEYRVEPITADAVLRGARAQQAWMRRGQS